MYVHVQIIELKSFKIKYQTTFSGCLCLTGKKSIKQYK